MSNIGEGIGEAIAQAMLALFVFGIVLGGLAIWGLPKLWHLLRPLVHSWTG